MILDKRSLTCVLSPYLTLHFLEYLPQILLFFYIFMFKFIYLGKRRVFEFVGDGTFSNTSTQFSFLLDLGLNRNCLIEI